MAKVKPQIGDSKKILGNVYVVEELFTADSTRWVRASWTRRIVKTKYENKKYVDYLLENKYFSELEWMRLNLK